MIIFLHTFCVDAFSRKTSQIFLAIDSYSFTVMYYTYALYFLRYADNLLQLDNGVKVPPRLVLVISALFLKFNNGDAVA